VARRTPERPARQVAQARSSAYDAFLYQRAGTPGLPHVASCLRRREEGRPLRREASKSSNDVRMAWQRPDRARSAFAHDAAESRGPSGIRPHPRARHTRQVACRCSRRAVAGRRARPGGCRFDPHDATGCGAQGLSQEWFHVHLDANAVGLAARFARRMDNSIAEASAFADAVAHASESGIGDLARSADLRVDTTGLTPEALAGPARGPEFKSRRPATRKATLSAVACSGREAPRYAREGRQRGRASL